MTLLSGKVVRNVEADVCAKCGERYYDLDAMRQLREARTGEHTRHPKVSSCPTCGSKRIRRKPVSVTLSDGKRVRVELDVCPDCGEQLFDPEAMRRIEALDPRNRRRRKPAD